VTTTAVADHRPEPPPGGGDGRPPAVIVRGLAKRYDEVEAVAGIDFEVRAGETFGFLGPNGY
jgi:ABC-type sugar transport system ATPase subunit